MTEMTIVAPSGDPVISDGAGRLLTRTITISDEQYAINEQKAWNITTGQITLTDDNPTVIHYVKNTDFDCNLIIPLYILLTGPSTNGSGLIQVEIIRNPTEGDIVTNKNLGEEVHQHFGGSRPFPGVNYKGATSEGNITGQTPEDSIIRSQTSASNRLLLGIITYLSQGSSIAIRVTPPTGNTSMVIESVMEIYEGSV